MTTTTPSPYNTARSMKASPRGTVNVASSVTALPGLKHIASKSGGDAPHASPVSSARQLPRPSSTGGASVTSSRSHVSQLSGRMKVSPYAIPLSSRSNTDKARATSRPDPPMSARSNARVEASTPRVNQSSPLDAPPSPINVSRGSDEIEHADERHPRPSEPSIDALLLREGLDPSIVPTTHDSKDIVESFSKLTDPSMDPADTALPVPVEKHTTTEPASNLVDDPHTVCSQEECELGESTRSVIDQVPMTADPSRISPDPSPIPMVNKLNLSQYSCAFADTIRGYCSDISSDCSHQDDRIHPESQINAFHEDAKHSVDVQVTSRLHENQQDSQENRKGHKKSWMKIMCCGCMQQK